MGKTAKYVSIIVLAILILITVLTSHSNKDNYFITAVPTLIFDGSVTL